MEKNWQQGDIILVSNAFDPSTTGKVAKRFWVCCENFDASTCLLGAYEWLFTWKTQYVNFSDMTPIKYISYQPICDDGILYLFESENCNNFTIMSESLECFIVYPFWKLLCFWILLEKMVDKLILFIEVRSGKSGKKLFILYAALNIIPVFQKSWDLGIFSSISRIFKSGENVTESELPMLLKIS